MKTTIKGEKELIAKLKKLGSKTAAKRVLRRAASAAITPLRRSVKSKVPVDTGHLKKAIKSKVSMRGFGVWAGVGVDADYAVRASDGTKLTRDEQKARLGQRKSKREKIIKPANYDHLVEFGTEDAPARPFLRPGYDAAKGQMRKTYQEKVADGLAREQQKLKGKK